MHLPCTYVDAHSSVDGKSGIQAFRNVHSRKLLLLSEKRRFEKRQLLFVCAWVRLHCEQARTLFFIYLKD
jgi:hypothetical protein